MSGDEFFEYVIRLPDDQLEAEAKTLIGFDQRFERLRTDLLLLSDPDAVTNWGRQMYGAAPPICTLVDQRYPLFIFAGDVGTGKTAFAKASAARAVRERRKEGNLFALSTRVRGEGRVGQASSQINAAFDHVRESLGKAKLGFLLIDEADSLVTSRGEEHSHLEDKVAVNTIIQKVDDLRRHGGRLVAFLATNRLDTIDAGVMRRAAAIERFERPNDTERLALLTHDLEGLNLRSSTLTELVQLTGAKNGTPAFTFSDLRTRFLPRVIAQALPTGRKITDDDALVVARELVPSPVVK